MTNINVAIVDDHDRVRDSIARLLKAVNFGVESFGSAEEFLMHYGDHETKGLSCLVLDVRMPGMSGIELLCELNDRGIRIPVILVSGHATRDIAELGRRNGAATLLEKPFEGEALVAEIHKAMEFVTVVPLSG